MIFVKMKEEILSIFYSFLKAVGLFFKRLVQLILLVVIIGLVTQFVFYFGNFSNEVENTIRKYGIIAALFIFWGLIGLDRYRHRKRLS